MQLDRSLLCRILIARLLCVCDPLAPPHFVRVRGVCDHFVGGDWKSFEDVEALFLIECLEGLKSRVLFCVSLALTCLQENTLGFQRMQNLRSAMCDRIVSDIVSCRRNTFVLGHAHSIISRVIEKRFFRRPYGDDSLVPCGAFSDSAYIDLFQTLRFSIANLWYIRAIGKITLNSFDSVGSGDASRRRETSSIAFLQAYKIFRCICYEQTKETCHNFFIRE